MLELRTCDILRPIPFKCKKNLRNVVNFPKNNQIFMKQSVSNGRFL
jgi:hypothetical protein